MILLADGIPTPSGAGISQTLSNLLDAYPGEITCVCTDSEQIDRYPDRLQTAIARYSTGPWKTWNNRIGRILNGYFTRRQLQWMYRQRLNLAQLPAKDRALVLVSTNVPHKLLYAWHLLQAGYIVLPYFMDDWLYDNRLAWKGNTVQQIAVDILRQAPCRLMISRQLEAILVKRYQLQKKPCLVVHNPAPVPRLAPQHGEAGISVNPAIYPGKEAGAYPVIEDGIGDHPSSAVSKQHPNHRQPRGGLIIYAGSIWPMHLDALQAVAGAVHFLNKPDAFPAPVQTSKTKENSYQLTASHPLEKTANAAVRASAAENEKITLRIYTSEATWHHNKSKLEGAGVEFAGWKAYSALPAFLNEAWLLLCTASFDDKYQAFSLSSVQTKLTDYMAAEKPVLFVGPSSAASGDFVHEWDCGYSINTSRPSDVAAQLLAISRMGEQSAKKAANGLAAARGYFSKAAVQQRLYRFLEEHVPQLSS